MTRFADLPPSRQAGILSSDRGFRVFVARALNFDSGGPASVGAAAEFIRRTARVASRADLDRDPAAAARFAALLTEWDALRGRLSKQERT